jgi:hypothetical protein
MAAIDPRSGESVDATADYETKYRQRKPAPFSAVAGSFLRKVLILTRFGANTDFWREAGHLRLGWRSVNSRYGTKRMRARHCTTRSRRLDQ